MSKSPKWGDKVRQGSWGGILKPHSKLMRVWDSKRTQVSCQNVCARVLVLLLNAYNVFIFKAEPHYAALNLLCNRAGLEPWILLQDYRWVYITTGQLPCI